MSCKDNYLKTYDEYIVQEKNKKVKISKYFYAKIAIKLFVALFAQDNNIRTEPLSGKSLKRSFVFKLQ